jgi:hypothetical protein
MNAMSKGDFSGFDTDNLNNIRILNIDSSVLKEVMPYRYVVDARDSRDRKEDVSLLINIVKKMQS